MDKQILDWNDYILAARQVTAEGIVMLENKNGTLPSSKAQNWLFLAAFRHTTTKAEPVQAAWFLLTR